MKKLNLLYKLYSFLFILTFYTSCKSQINTLPQDNKVKTMGILKQGHPKLIKTQGLTSGNIICQLQDRSGNIWFSSNGEGVYRYDGKLFYNYTIDDGLSENNVNSIIEDKDGYILFGTHDGISRYDGHKFHRYLEKSLLNSISVSTLLEARNGDLWIGTLDRGVFRYDGKNLNNYLNSTGDRFNPGNNYQTILDIMQDKKGNIWFSSWNGGGVWCFDGMIFTNYVPSAEYYLRNEDGRSIEKNANDPLAFKQPLSKNFITDDMIFSIAEDKNGHLWFATRDHGACRYDGKTFTSYRESEGLDSRGVYDIHEDKKGNMWLTTEDSGIWCYNGESFKNFTSKDGLINDSVFSVLEDKAGNLWFGTRGFGLSRYDGQSFTSY